MSQTYSSESSETETYSHSDTTKLESAAFFIFLIAVIVAPLAFLPTKYIALDTIKTAVIALGALIPAILYGVMAYKEKKIILPPRRMVIAAGLLALSLLASSIFSTHFLKSFFGQGFELSSASFILVVLLAGGIACIAVQRRIERTMMMYIGMVAAFLLLFVLHASRFIFGPEFLTLGVLNSITATLVGNWYDLATYAGIISILILSAFLCLPLSRRMRIFYGLIILAAFATLFIVNSFIAWTSISVTFLALAVFLTVRAQRTEHASEASFLRKIAWMPLVVCIIAGIFSWKGVEIASPAILKLNASYGSLTLPWQYSLDVAVGAAKENPLFGVGSNRYTQAYLVHKPAVINAGNAWSTEFNFAFGLLPTFVTTQGFVGVLAWIIFLIGAILLLIHAFKKLPEDPYARFIVISSSGAAFFLWIVSLISVPSHSIFFLTLVCTGIAIGSAAAQGVLDMFVADFSEKKAASALLRYSVLLLIVLGVLWGIVYVKKAAALIYFGSGIKAINASDVQRADRDFALATKIDKSEVYLQARAETALIQANQALAAISSSTSTEASQKMVNGVVQTVNAAINYSVEAIKYDPTDYYSYVSAARVSSFALNIKMDTAYEKAVGFYQDAIRTNPLNPSLYLSLAQLYASQNKLDEALQAVGSALQLKNNYLDAIFLLSQISAAQGKTKDAITAAQVAAQINPQSPVIYFQLGLLHYTDKNYTDAAAALEKAIALQPEYANAKYFLGLSYARLSRTADAIKQFEELSKTNPENDEVKLILGNLRAGRSAFADAQPPVTPTPEKRSKLPITEKKK